MQNDIPKVGFLVNFAVQKMKIWGFLLRSFCSKDFVLWFSFFGSRSSVLVFRFLHFVSRTLVLALWFSYFGSRFSVLELVARLLGCMVTWNFGSSEHW